MPTRLLEGTPGPDGMVAVAGPPAPKGLLAGRDGALPLISVAALVLLVGAGNNSYMLLGLGLIAVFVLLSNLAPAPAIDPTELSLSAFLTIVIAVPFGKLPHNRNTSIIFVLALLVVSLSALARAQLRPPPGRFLVMALFVLLVPASLYGPDKGAIKILILTAAAAVPAFFLGAQLDRARLRAVSVVILALAVTEAAMAVAEPFAFPRHLWVSAPTSVDGSTKGLKNPFFSGYERSQATLGHPLALGLLLVVAIALLIRVLTDLKLWIRLASAGVLLIGLVFSGDRSCMLAVLLIVIAGKRLTSARVFISLGILLAGVLAAVAANAVSSSAVTNFASSGSYLHRASAYSLIWRLFTTQPLVAAFGGNGFGSTQRLFDAGLLQTDGFNVVDNQFVLIQAQGGVLCLLALLIVCGLAIRYARRELRPTVIFAVGVSLIFDWMSWPSASALIFMLLGAALSNLQPSVVANRLQLGSQSALVPRAREASLQE